MREASLAPLSHPTLRSLPPRSHTKLRSRGHVCGGLSLSPPSRRDQELGTSRSLPEQREPNSVRATSAHPGPCSSPPSVPRSTPPSSLNLHPSRSDLPSPSSDSAGLNETGPALPPLQEPTQGWAPGLAWGTRRQGGALHRDGLLGVVLRLPPGLFTRREAVDSFPTCVASCPPSRPGHPGPSLVSQPPWAGSSLDKPSRGKWSELKQPWGSVSALFTNDKLQVQRGRVASPTSHSHSCPRTSTGALSRKFQPF